MWVAIAGVALLVGGIAIGAAVAGGGDDPGTSATSSTTVTVTSAPEQAQPADDGTRPSLRFPKQSGNWRLDSLQVKDDGLGSFAADGQITYTGGDESGGHSGFTVTLVNNAGEVVATLGGFVSDVEPGETVTTELSGSDPYKPGKFRSTFQPDR